MVHTDPAASSAAAARRVHHTPTSRAVPGARCCTQHSMLDLCIRVPANASARARCASALNRRLSGDTRRHAGFDARRRRARGPLNPPPCIDHVAMRASIQRNRICLDVTALARLLLLLLLLLLLHLGMAATAAAALHTHPARAFKMGASAGAAAAHGPTTPSLDRIERMVECALSSRGPAP